jgi:hypothetical protein
MFTKKNLAFSFVIFMAAGSLFFLWFRQSFLVGINSAEKLDTVNISSSVNAGFKEGVSISKSATAPALEKLTSIDRERISAWRRSRGYFSDAELNDYNTYDIATLKKLALDGDFKALELVARYKMSHGEEAYTDFYYAALHGSTHAFLALSFLIENKFVMENLTDQEKTKYSIDALALLRAAGIRGDETLASDDVASFKRRRGFNPTPEQQVEIDRLTQEIYDRLVAQRVGMGLPEFDNTPSPEIHKMVELNKKQ